MDTVVGAYLAHLAGERGLARNTLLAYRRDLRRYLSYLAGRGRRALSDVRVEDVAAFAATLRAEALSEASVARTVVAVRGLHRFALREGVVAADVAHDVAPPAPPLRLPTAVSVERVEALLDAAAAADPPYGLRDRALLELLYGTGARISEAVGLDLDRLDPTERTVRLAGSGGRDRVVPLGAPATDALDSYVLRARPELTAAGRGSCAVFLNARGGRLSRQSGWAILKTAAERAKLSADISPHTLRHSFATHLLDGGADVRVVQELLGHASVTRTQVYASAGRQTLREVYAGSHPRALD